MKKRLGFVSNSSSSSFLIIGKEISQDKINEENIEDIVFESAFSGEYGQIMGKFDSMKMFNKYIEHVSNNNDLYHDTTYYHSKFNMFEDEGEMKINPEDIEKGSKAYFGTTDQFVIDCERDLDEVIEWYE